MKRILGVVRLSQLTDESTSPLRQKETIQHWADAPHVEGEVIGWAVDLDVSGGLSPFKRPELGPWLTERADEFDTIAFMKIDRISRRSAHFSELIEWCQTNGKTMHSVQEGFDLDNAYGKMLAQMIAVFAEGELDVIKARIKDGVATRLAQRVWIGGRPSMGYTLEKASDGVGKRCVQDKDYAPNVRRIFDLLMQDWTPFRIAAQLTEDKVLTWVDRQRETAGNKVRNAAWRADSVISALSNPRVAGIYTYQGEIVEDENGTPVLITDEPILSYHEWEKAVIKLGELAGATPAKKSQSMLAGVGSCSVCGRSLAAVYGTGKLASGEVKKYPRYRCSTYSVPGGKCPQKLLVDRPTLESLINTMFLGTVGSLEIHEKVSGPTNDYESELKAVTARLSKLEGDFIKGKYDGDEKEASYWRMQESLTSRITVLRKKAKEQQNKTPGFRPTGQTFAKVWKQKDDDQKRTFMQKHGVSVKVLNRKTNDDPVTVVLDLGDIIGMARSAGLQLPTGVKDKWVVLNLAPGEVEGFVSDLKSGTWWTGELPRFVTARELAEVAAEEWVDRHRDDY
ncbi:recombinase family protein [Streptomyces sp. NPDC058373]|uniref:recombinase family protein n=1 Tax=Streptomyces sp. NPDC058373 TaxID=3346465 RepID=UPI0036557DAC